MQPFRRLDGRAVPLPQANIDTDQIIPKQFLKTLERRGLGRGLFYDLRFEVDGRNKSGFVLNRPEYKGASVLITGDNFGCGSSREHAPWALIDFGISCVISSSFADIFYQNCFQNGLLPVVLRPPEVQLLMEEAKGGNHLVTIDLVEQSVVSPSGRTFRFDVDPGLKHKMLNGLDAIAETLREAEAIDAFEQRRRGTPAASAGMAGAWPTT